jgi:hypothetical protein
MRFSFLCLAALGVAGAARADEAPKPVPDDTAELHAALPPRYHYSSFGPMLSVDLGSGMPGDHLAGDLGFQTFGVREFNRTWLSFWDAALAVRLGGLANQHPFFFFGGGTGRGSGELGRRIVPENDWSPYVSGRLDGDLTIMATPSANGLSGLNMINNSDGFGGITGNLNARLSGGISFLRQRRSFVATLFLQEALRAPRTYTPGYAFTEGGLLARYDIADSFTLWVEGIVGSTPETANTALAATERTITMNVSGALRKTFGNGIWFSVGLSYGRDTHTLSYTNGQSYGSAQPPTFLAAVALGIPLGGKP